MSETAPERPGGRKILGLNPRTAAIAGGGIFVAAVGYLWWKRKQGAAAQPTVSSSASSSTSGIDYGGELSVIQSELEDLLAAQGQQSSTGSTGSTGGGSSRTSGGGTGTSAGGTGTATKTAAPATPAAHETKVTRNSVTLAWGKVPNATSYRIRVTYQGKLVGGTHTVGGTSATVSGLTPDHTYTFHVAAVGPGGTSPESNGPAVKTSR